MDSNTSNGPRTTQGAGQSRQYTILRPVRVAHYPVMQAGDVFDAHGRGSEEFLREQDVFTKFFKEHGLHVRYVFVELFCEPTGKLHEFTLINKDRPQDGFETEVDMMVVRPDEIVGAPRIYAVPVEVEVKFEASFEIKDPMQDRKDDYFRRLLVAERSGEQDDIKTVFDEISVTFSPEDVNEILLRADAELGREV